MNLKPRSSTILAGPILTCVALLCIADDRPAANTSAEFSRSIQPFLAKNCYACHNAKLKTGGLNFEGYTSAAAVAQNQDDWEKISRRLRAGEMPPATRPQPAAAEVHTVTNWIENELDRIPRTSSPLRVHRLNRVEYNNTVRDLLGVNVNVANDFPPDDSVFGFDNIAQALTVSPSLMAKYLATAERISKSAVFGQDLSVTTDLLKAPLPRRLEFANPVQITQPAYYSMQNYDLTGLSQPGSFHETYNFPVDGEYELRIVGAGNRPAGSEVGECQLYIDGKLAQAFVVEGIESDGFIRRADHWDTRRKFTAGPHEIVIAFPRQFHGLPVAMGGPAPSSLPLPPPNPAANPEAQKLRLAKLEADLAGETDIAKISQLKNQVDQLRNPLPPRYSGWAVSEVNVTGPFHYTRKPTQESLKRVYTCGHLEGHHSPSCRRVILSNLATRAFRRPVRTEELTRLEGIAAGAVRNGGSFDEGVSLGLTAILVSPQMLFRIDAAPSGIATNQYELASRLSYFLWSSMPDDELFGLAKLGTLIKPDVLSGQVRRMLADTKAQALVSNFMGQWLETRRLEEFQPDRDRFPDFDEYLRQSMIKETQLFFSHIMREDRSVLELIDGKYTFLNERLAAHYGIPGVKGTEFRKVDLTGTARSGVLTHASVLASTAYPNRTSVVLRGKWILENILNQKVPPPPANIPSLNGDAVGETASLRQQMEQHRNSATCATCHSRMDPLGFSLENYDAVGSWRTMDGKFPIDSSGKTPQGKAFDGASGMKEYLRENRDEFARCLTEKMLTYALGRGQERADRPAVRQIVSRMAQDDYKFSTLVMGIVNSSEFNNKAMGVELKR